MIIHSIFCQICWRVFPISSQQVTVEPSTRSPCWGRRRGGEVHLHGDTQSSPFHSSSLPPPPRNSSGHYKKSALAGVVQSRHQLHQVRQAATGKINWNLVFSRRESEIYFDSILKFSKSCRVAVLWDLNFWTWCQVLATYFCGSFRTFLQLRL